METEKISSRNLRSLLILMVLCGSLMNGAFTLAQDNWIAVLLMMALYLPVILICSRICLLLPGKDLYDIIHALFGPVMRFVLVLLMTGYALVVTALQLRNFTEFTVVISLKNTPHIPIMIALILPVLYLAKQGLQVLGRWSTVICITIVTNVLLSISLALNIMDLSHILPVMDHSIIEIADNAFMMGSIAIGETAIAMIIMGSRQENASPYKIYIPGVLAGVGMFILIVLRNLCILGPALEGAAKFSTYLAVRIIHLGRFLERIESSISFIYILIGITKMTLFLIAASMGVAKLLKVSDYKKLLIPTGLFVLTISTMAFKNVFELFEVAWTYRYYALPFQLLVPIVIWIAAERQAKKNRTAAKALTQE